MSQNYNKDYSSDAYSSSSSSQGFQENVGASEERTRRIVPHNSNHSPNVANTPYNSSLANSPYNPNTAQGSQPASSYSQSSQVPFQNQAPQFSQAQYGAQALHQGEVPQQQGVTYPHQPMPVPSASGVFFNALKDTSFVNSQFRVLAKPTYIATIIFIVLNLLVGVYIAIKLMGMDDFTTIGISVLLLSVAGAFAALTLTRVFLDTSANVLRNADAIEQVRDTTFSRQYEQKN